MRRLSHEVSAPSMRIPEPIDIELFIGHRARIPSSRRVSVGHLLACFIWKVGRFSTINILHGWICSSHFLGMLVTLFVIASLAVLSLSVMYEDLSVASSGAKDLAGEWSFTYLSRHS